MMVRIDALKMSTLAETDPAALPPIAVHRMTMRVIDGFHRVQSATARGDAEISARFYDGTDAESFVHVVRCNTAHGLPLNLDSRNAAALRILQDCPHCSDRAIPALVRLSAKTVSAIRSSSTDDTPQSNEARLGRDDRLRPASTAEGRRYASQLLQDNPNAPLREIASRVGISLGTAHDVGKRLRNGQDPVPLQQRKTRASARQTAKLESTRPHYPVEDSPAAQRVSQQLIAFLLHDPALRSTDTGRALLRLLTTHKLVLTYRDAAAAAVPPHCSSAMVDAARECAKLWQQFANLLSHREQERE